MKTLKCYAWGRQGDWEAICVDLDIAVSGRSMHEVMETLQNAIRTYIADAMQEDEMNRARLLNRRSPWHVRAKLALGSAYASFSAPKDDGHATFGVACPA